VKQGGYFPYRGQASNVGVLLRGHKARVLFLLCLSPVPGRIKPHTPSSFFFFFLERCFFPLAGRHLCGLPAEVYFSVTLSADKEARGGFLLFSLAYRNVTYSSFSLGPITHRGKIDLAFHIFLLYFNKKNAFFLLEKRRMPPLFSLTQRVLFPRRDAAGIASTCLPSFPFLVTISKSPPPACPPRAS